MALSNDDKTFIYNYFNQTLQQDLLTNSLFMGSRVGQSLRDMVLAKQPVQPLTNPSEQALTGTLRADSRTLRQAASNVGEAANMMGVAKDGVAQISDALADLEDIIDKINEGELTASSSVVQSDYDALVTKIQGLVAGTDYNGIYMLDGSQWDTDQIDADGNVWIQGLKNGGFDITFHNLDAIDWTQLQGTDLVADLNGQLALVESYTSDVDAVLDVYTGKQTSLEYQQTQITSQAEMLDQAVANRSPQTSALTVEELLYNLLLSDTGGLIDKSG